MNVAIATAGERVAPCFAGAELWIVGPDRGIDEHRTIHTAGRDPLYWARELLRLDVGTLLCTGIDQFVWGALEGNGIRVVPEAAGAAGEVLARWRAGELRVPVTWQRPERPGPQRRARVQGRFRGGR